MECTECRRRFGSAEELRRHRAEHHADAPLEPDKARTEEILTTGTNMTEQSGTRPPPGTAGPATP
jgi:hypothetical protein